MAYEILSHTADTGVEATAPTLAGLISELANGMFASMAEPTRGPAEVQVEGTVEAGTMEDLVVDTLSELLYRAETEGLVLEDVVVAGDAEEGRIRFVADGVGVDSIETSGPPIKAVTYHDLRVEEQDGQWHGRVYFDV